MALFWERVWLHGCSICSQCNLYQDSDFTAVKAFTQGMHAYATLFMQKIPWYCCSCSVLFKSSVWCHALQPNWLATATPAKCISLTSSQEGDNGLCSFEEPLAAYFVLLEKLVHSVKAKRWTDLHGNDVKIQCMGTLQHASSSYSVLGGDTFDFNTSFHCRLQQTHIRAMTGIYSLGKCFGGMSKLATSAAE